MTILIVTMLALFGNGLQFQKDFDRCKAVDFKESKCELHKSNYEKYGKKA